MTTESSDPAFHFPPDLFNAVVDAIPLLTRSKQDVLIFLRGCGLDRAYLETLAERVRSDPEFGKYHMIREALVHLNDGGDRTIQQRRELLKRIVEFEDFDGCYPDNKLKAKGAVGTVAGLINRKDSFTRLQQAHEEEIRRHREAKESEVAERNARRKALDALRGDFFALFSHQDPQRRGKALEGVLNRLFAYEGFLVREAFVVRGDQGAGVLEQIDGAIEVDGRVYLVEMKWWDKPLGRGDVASHLVSVFNRGDAGGIFISASGFTSSAIEDYKQALTRKTVVLVEIEEIVKAFTVDHPVATLIRSKIREATLAKRPLARPLDD